MRLVTKLVLGIMFGAILALAPLTAAGQDVQRQPDVPYVPTPEDVVEAMLKLANVTKNDVVYDLGCGDGRIVITAAQKYGARRRRRHQPGGSRTATPTPRKRASPTALNSCSRTSSRPTSARPRSSCSTSCRTST